MLYTETAPAPPPHTLRNGLTRQRWVLPRRPLPKLGQRHKRAIGLLNAPARHLEALAAQRPQLDRVGADGRHFGVGDPAVPAVVVPGMLDLGQRGYGVAKGVPTMVVAAASFDDVLAIAGFGVCLALAAQSESAV